MLLMIIIKYRGGIMVQSQRYTAGMFSTGKIKPERRMVGSISPIREIKIACCIVLETVDIRIPRERLMRI